jgi:hypothetical protein
MNTRWPLKAVPLALLALLMAGCSSSSSDDDATPEPTPEPTTDPSPAPTPDPSPVPTPDPSVVPTATPTLAPIPSPSPTPSVVPSPTATATPTAVASPTPSVAPSPTPTAAPEPGGSASQCFNPVLYAAGSVYTLGEVTTAGEDVYNSTTTITVDGPVVFEGNTVTRLFGNVVGSIEGTGTFQLFLTAENLQVLGYGAIVEITEPVEAAGSSTVVNDPPELDRFDLSPGDSYSQTYTQTVTVDGPFGPGQFTQTVEFERTYVGPESLRTRGGGFAVCRFDQTETVTTTGLAIQEGGETVILPTEVTESSFSEWLGVGNGLPIKTVDDDGTTTELVSATINGQVIFAE